MKIRILSTRNGFTLIELLLVAAILLSTSVCVFSSFSQGIKIFYRLKASTKDEAVAFLLEKVTSDLKNSCGFAQFQVRAGSDRLSFPVVDRSAAGATRAFFDAPPAVVTYLYLGDTQEVVRIKQQFPFNEKAFRREEVVARDIRSFSFEPLVRRTILPAKMSVRIEYGDKVKPRVIQKDVLIPIYYGNKT